MTKVEEEDDDEEDSTKKEKVQVSKGAVSSKPKPLREWQGSETMKEASKFATLLHYQPKMLYQQKAGPRSANDGQDIVLLAPTVGDDIISSPNQDNVKAVNAYSTLPSSSCRQSGTEDFTKFQPKTVVNTYPVLNTNIEKLRRLYQSSVPRSAKDGHAVFMASPEQNPFMPTRNVIDYSTLPTTGLNNYLSQNNLHMIRQQCQPEIKKVSQHNTDDFVVPPMAKRPKFSSSSFEQDYQAACTALNEITGMNATTLPHPTFAKKVSSVDEIVNAVADRFVSMLDTSETASLALKKITDMKSAPSPPHPFTTKVSSGSELGHAVAVHHSVVDSYLINSSSHSSLGITASPGSMDELSAVCQQYGISRLNLPVLNTPNPSQNKGPLVKQQPLDTDNRSYLKYQMPSGTLSSLPSSGSAFSVPPPGCLNTSYVSQHLNLKMTRNSTNCNDLDSRLSSSSLTASSLPGDVFTHKVMTNKNMHHMNNVIASSEHEADTSLLQMQEQAAIMSEMQQRIISQQEQNRQIRIRQRQLLLQMYHHQYQLALQSSTPPSQETIKLLRMLHDLKDKMLLETNNRVMTTNDDQFEQQFLDLLQLLEFSIGGNSSIGMVGQKK
jgi:hypothetical protein